MTKYLRAASAPYGDVRRMPARMYIERDMISMPMNSTTRSAARAMAIMPAAAKLTSA